MCVYVWISVHIINPCVSDPNLSIHELGCTADCQSRSMLAITDWFMGYSRIWADMFMWISAQICKGVRRDTHRYSRIRTHLNGLNNFFSGEGVNITWIYVNISWISCLNLFKSCLNDIYMFKYPLLGEKNYLYSRDLNTIFTYIHDIHDMFMWISSILWICINICAYRSYPSVYVHICAYKYVSCVYSRISMHICIYLCKSVNIG